MASHAAPVNVSRRRSFIPREEKSQIEEMKAADPRTRDSTNNRSQLNAAPPVQKTAEKRPDAPRGERRRSFMGRAGTQNRNVNYVEALAKVVKNIEGKMINKDNAFDVNIQDTIKPENVL